MGLFDKYQEKLWKVINPIFGDLVTWSPSSGGADVSGIALFRNPTNEEMLLDGDLQPENAVIEWEKGDFQGLYESIRGSGVESIEHLGVDYLAWRGFALADGKTYKAYISRK